MKMVVTTNQSPQRWHKRINWALS